MKKHVQDVRLDGGEPPTTYVGAPLVDDVRAILLISAELCPLDEIPEALAEPQAVVEQAHSAEQVGEMIGAFRWDLVLLDGRTPRLAGEVLVQLLEAYAEAPPKIFLVVGGPYPRLPLPASAPRVVQAQAPRPDPCLPA